ncbi:hypothetical protein M3Y99_01844700 [Aphelenchoides fujianensis]|nr:hypothetical protein M3Y99_01844700 [Aphelenchoides fujianensis]
MMKKLRRRLNHAFFGSTADLSDFNAAKSNSVHLISASTVHSRLPIHPTAQPNGYPQMREDPPHNKRPVSHHEARPQAADYSRPKPKAQERPSQSANHYYAHHQQPTASARREEPRARVHNEYASNGNLHHHPSGQPYSSQGYPRHYAFGEHPCVR